MQPSHRSHATVAFAVHLTLPRRHTHAAVSAAAGLVLLCRHSHAAAVAAADQAPPCYHSRVAVAAVAAVAAVSFAPARSSARARKERSLPLPRGPAGGRTPRRRSRRSRSRPDPHRDPRGPCSCSPGPCFPCCHCRCRCRCRCCCPSSSSFPFSSLIFHCSISNLMFPAAMTRHCHCHCYRPRPRPCPSPPLLQRSHRSSSRSRPSIDPPPTAKIPPIPSRGDPSPRSFSACRPPCRGGCRAPPTRTGRRRRDLLWGRRRPREVGASCYRRRRRRRPEGGTRVPTPGQDQDSPSRVHRVVPVSPRRSSVPPGSADVSTATWPTRRECGHRQHCRRRRCRPFGDIDDDRRSLCRSWDGRWARSRASCGCQRGGPPPSLKDGPAGRPSPRRPCSSCGPPRRPRRHFLRSRSRPCGHRLRLPS
mmetsp:Transcript_42947/g.130674  ORF Transcript_42947/g.130674 Transcript_42947/m.130674 type:complete len:420 (+) Transcript_42947:2191-3450(+)